MSFLAFALMALGQGPASEPELAANPLYRTILSEGLVVEGVTVKLPPPCLREGMTEPERRAALKKEVELPLDEFLRDSTNAPFKLKVRDVTYPGGIIRVVDLWFAIHADLHEIDLDQLAGKKDKAGQVEAGNMRFSARTLTDAELKDRPKSAEGTVDRYIFSKGLLLDRIDVSTVNHIVASKAGGTLVVASMTDPAFKEGDLANRWVSIPGSGDSKKEPGPPRPYEGSAGYSRHHSILGKAGGLAGGVALRVRRTEGMVQRGLDPPLEARPDRAGSDPPAPQGSGRFNGRKKPGRRPAQ